MDAMARLNPASLCLLGCLALAPACNRGGDEPPAEDTPKAAEPAEPAPAKPEPAAQTPSERMFAWLDPEARGAAFVRLPDSLDPALVATVFAMPPAAADLLEDAAEVDEALEAVAPVDGPGPDTWIGREALAMQPSLSTDAYVIKPITKPRAEVEAWLMETGMEKRVVEGFTVLLPTGPLPHKIVFLTDELIAFVPLREIGNGLGPLTAGRDLPPSELRKQMVAAVKGVGGTVVELMAYGPILHLDLDQDVHAARLAVRDWQNGGLDGQLLLQVSRDGPGAQKALEARKTPLETDAVQTLVDKVAFTADGPRVEGRLQIPAEDVIALRGSSP